MFLNLQYQLHIYLVFLQINIININFRFLSYAESSGKIY